MFLFHSNFMKPQFFITVRLLEISYISHMDVFHIVFNIFQFTVNLKNIYINKHICIVGMKTMKTFEGTNVRILVIREND